MVVAVFLIWSECDLKIAVITILTIDKAIAPFTCTPEEAESAYKQFCCKNQLTSETELQTWLECNGMTTQELQTYVTRSLKIEKFKQATWGHKLESYFLSHKSNASHSLRRMAGDCATPKS
ncbi:hypothetical protein [Scytonema sp. PCC 10023]|uniref:hypothetical protein n=1 Tax=Scytonema sp. PCC 10023 TaxID=1680591 RepID=UPI0039C608F9